MDPESGSTPEQNDQGNGQGQGRSFSQSELDQVVARVRREWQEKLDGVSRERDELKARVGELEPAVAERDTLKTRVTELEPQVGQKTVENALLVEAVKRGASRPDHVMRLVDSSGVRLEEGKVKGAVEAIDALAKDEPRYFQSSPAAPGDGGARDRSAPPPQQNANDQINAALRGAAGYPSR